MGLLSEEQARQMMLARTGFSTTGELDAAMKEYGSVAEVKQSVRDYIEGENMSPAANFESLSSGQMHRELCRAYCEESPRWFGRNRSVPQETSLLVLQAAHDAARHLEYTDGNRTKEWLATDGVDLFSRRDWAQMYRALFTYAVDVHVWQRWIPEEMRVQHFNLVQDDPKILLFISGVEYEVTPLFARLFRWKL